MWAFLNPFYSKAATTDRLLQGYLSNPTKYGKGCHQNELAVLSGEPKYASNDRIPRGIQDLDCISPVGFSGEPYVKLFSPNIKEIELDHDVKTITISDEFLEKEIFVFDRKQNELLEEIPSSLTKVTLNSDAEVLVKIKLKKDYPIPIPTENRAIDFCTQLEIMQQEQYNGRYFGACLYALSSNDAQDEPFCHWGHCSSHLVFQTVEEVGFNMAKRYESGTKAKKIFLAEMPKTNFRYRVNVHDIEGSNNNINAVWDLPQNERKRSFAKR